MLLVLIAVIMFKIPFSDKEMLPNHSQFPLRVDSWAWKLGINAHSLQLNERVLCLVSTWKLEVQYDW